MKRCPTCKKEYSKDTETHCWLDGTLLVTVQPPLPPIPQQKPAAANPPLPPPPPPQSAPAQSIAVDKICYTCQKTIHKTTASVCFTCQSPLQVPPPVVAQQKVTQPPAKSVQPPLPPLPQMPPFKPSPPAVVAKCPNSPKYEPKVWNDAKPNKLGGVQLTTNCYSYAANDKGEGHPIDGGQGQPYKPQPGELCGHPFYNQTHPDDPQKGVLDDCAVVKQAVECDSKSQPNKLGMIPVPVHPPKDKLPPEKAGYYLVALVVAPGVDYHWYRQDDNGKWSHKPGSYPITNHDASGNEIDNPRTCDRDGSKTGSPNYSLFCGYYYVPKCGVLVGTNTQDAKDKHKLKGIN